MFLTASAEDKKVMYWVSLKFPEGVKFTNDSSMLCFSAEANIAYNNQFLKFIYTHGDEDVFMNLSSSFPRQKLNELSLCYGYLWKCSRIMIDLGGGIGVMHSLFHGKLIPDTSVTWVNFNYSNMHETIDEMTPIVKVIGNAYVICSDYFAVGLFLEAFLLKSQPGIFFGANINFGQFYK